MPLLAKRRALVAWTNCLEIGNITKMEDIRDLDILTRLAHLVKQKADPLQDLSSLKTTADCLAFICNAVKECREFKVKLDSLVSRLVLEDEQHPDLAMEIAKFLAFLVGWFVSDCDIQKALMKLDVDIQNELLAILELFASESDCLRDELEILLLKDSTGPLVPQIQSPATPLCPITPKNTSMLNSNFEYIATPMKDFFERNRAYRQHRLHRAEIDREELEIELASVREEMSKERAKLFQLQDQVERQRELLHHDQPSPSDKLVRKLESQTMSLNRMNKLCDELEEEKKFLQERVDEMTKENGVLEEKFESRMLNFEMQKKELNDMVCEAKEKESEQASMLKEYEALLVEAQHQREDLQQRLEIQLSKSAALAEKVCTCNCSGDIMSNVLQIEELKTEVSRVNAENDEFSRVMLEKDSIIQEEKNRIDGLLRYVSTLKENNQDVLRKIDQLLEEKKMCAGQVSMLTIENQNLKGKLSTFNKIKNLQMVELGTQTTFHNDDPEPLPAPSEIKELQLQQLKKQVDKASECCQAKSKLAQDLTAFLGERERELKERDTELTTVREASKASERRSKAKQHMLVETIRSLKSQLDFADKRAQKLDGAPQSNARRVTPCVPQDHMTVPLPVRTRPLALKRKQNDCAKLFLDKTANVKAGTHLNEVTAIKTKATMDLSRDSLESSPSIIPSLESHARTAGDISFELCRDENMLDEGEVQECEFFRIAELQRRNRRCLPHMKSSYPAETQTYCKDATDEQMKTGDPMEMIQRTSLVPDSRPNHTQRTSLNIGARSRRCTMAPTDFMHRPRAPWAAAGRQHQYCRSKPTPQSSFGGVLLGREPRSNVQHKRAADPQTLFEDEAFGINYHRIQEEASPEQICRRQSIAFKIDNTPPRPPSRRPLRPVPNRGQRPMPNRGPGSISQAMNQTCDEDATVEQMRTGDSMETIQRTSLVPGSRPNHVQRTLRSVPNRGTGSISQAMNKVPRGNSSKR